MFPIPPIIRLAGKSCSTPDTFTRRKEDAREERSEQTVLMDSPVVCPRMF